MIARKVCPFSLNKSNRVTAPIELRTSCPSGHFVKGTHRE
jgi:hypothetical protein